MAPRVLLLIIFITVGLLATSSLGLELGLQFSVEPQDVVVSRNKPSLLQCSSPTQNVSFQWTVDNKPLSLANNSRIQLLTNGSLYFRKVFHKRSGQGPSDQGVYRCIIHTPTGALVSRPAHLRFASMSHEFLVGGRGVSVVEGDPALLPCSIESLPAAEISWFHNSQPLPQSDRYIILDNGTLIINQVEKENEGDYSCTAWNSLVNKTRESEVFTLSVEARTSPSPLEILTPGTLRTNWTLGDNVTLACVARGTPTPTVKWTKLLPDQSSGLVSDVTQGVNILHIQNVTASHASVYTCVASQILSQRKTNTVSVTKEVVVEEVLSPPVLTKKPKSQVFPTAKTVRFQCEAEGNPVPEVVWYKNGYKLHINGRIKLRDELVLSNTVSNDSGVYQCIATNSVGSVWAAARLLVNVSRDQPRPPTHLVCTTLSDTTVHLTWEQINPIGLKAFTIHLLPTDGGEERMFVKEMVVGQQNQTFTVDKLPPYTNYTFYVRSYNSNAASDNSEEVVCQTGESVPRGAPQTTARPQSAMTVLVEWRPLSAIVARGVVTEYKVQWRRRHNPSSHVDFVPPDVTRYVITGLIPDTQYEVRVLAATQEGWPSLSEHEMPWTQVTTLSLTPLLPPPTIQLTVINATTIQVRWTLISDSVRVEGFHISYRKHNAQPTTPIQLSANISEYLLLDLEPQTWYEVQVKGLSGMTEGEIGVKAIHTLPPLQASPAPALSPPTNLEATPTSSSSINVTWEPPLTPAPANASYYTISYLVVPSSIHGDDNNTNFLHSTSNGVQVTGLKPYTLYELKVRTHDYKNQHSEYSQTLECRTLEDVPEKPLEVQWKPLNTSSVRVMWKEPNVTNGQIKGYTVSYTKVFRLERWKNVTQLGTRPFTDVTGLSPNTRYTVVVRAATSAGLGSPSDAIEMYIPARGKPSSSSSTPSSPPPQESNDQFLGILLGCAIGGSCVVLCMVSLIYRRRCAKPGQGQCRAAGSNGTPCFHSSSEHHEMQCLPGHLDTKGQSAFDYTGCLPLASPEGGRPNNEVNGLRLPLLSNGRLSNGLVTRDRNVRITENPQFECGVTVSCEELRQPSDEGDSLLSGHSLNDTQQPAPAPAALALCDKQEPDDGFHESHLPIVGPNG